LSRVWRWTYGVWFGDNAHCIESALGCAQVALYERSVIAKRDSKPHMFDVATGDVMHVWDVQMDVIDMVVVSGSDMLISSSHTDEFRIVDLAGDLGVVRTVVRALASECRNMIGLNIIRGTKVLLDSDRHARSLLFHVCVALVIARLVLFHISVALLCCRMQRQTMAVMADGFFMRLDFFGDATFGQVLC
jgi:hypothetical protein